MSVIFALIVPVIVSLVFVFLARKIRVPVVVALILGGIFLGLPRINEVVIGDNVGLINVLGNLGLFTLMFIAGLDTSWKKLFAERKDSVFIAFFAFLTPFILGFFVFYFFLHVPLVASLIVAIGMSITAEATKARVLIGLRALKTRMGVALMGAGIIDDVIGLALFMLVAILLGGADLTESFLTVGVIGAFFVGIVFQKHILTSNKFIARTKWLLLSLVVPFFFVKMGMSFDPGLFLNGPMLIVCVLLIGTSGKIIGTLLTKPFVNFNWKQLYAMGWAMNSRGAIEIALALIALHQGLIDQEIYSALIVLALATTMTFPFIFSSIVKKSRKILNQSSLLAS